MKKIAKDKKAYLLARQKAAIVAKKERLRVSAKLKADALAKKSHD